MKEIPPVFFFGSNEESTQAFHIMEKLKIITGIKYLSAGSLDEEDKPGVRYLGCSWEGPEEIKELAMALGLREFVGLYASRVVLKTLIEEGKIQTLDEKLFKELKPYLQQLGLNRGLNPCPNPWGCEEYDTCEKVKCDYKDRSLTHYLKKVRDLKRTGICSSAPEYLVWLLWMSEENQR